MREGEGHMSMPVQGLRGCGMYRHLSCDGKCVPCESHVMSHMILYL